MPASYSEEPLCAPDCVIAGPPRSQSLGTAYSRVTRSRTNRLPVIPAGYVSVCLSERNLLFASGVIGGFRNGERGGLIPASWSQNRP